MSAGASRVTFVADASAAGGDVGVVGRERRLSRSAGWPLRLVSAGAGLAGVAWVGWLTLIRPELELRSVVNENGWLELAQPWLWAASGLVTALTCLAARARRDTLIAAWMTLLCLLGGLRELDLHTVLNPANIHLLGLSPEHAVRFRLDWWLSAEAPVGARVLWALAALVIAGAVIVPFACARIPWFWMLWKREVAVWLLFLGAGLVASGYVMDDFIGRAPAFAWVGSAAEEGAEFAGQLALLAGAAMLMLRGPTARARGWRGPGHADRIP